MASSKVHPLEAKEEANDASSEMERLFKPLTIVLNIGGMYIPSKRERASRVINILYCVVLNLLLWMGTLRFLFRFSDTVTAGKWTTLLSSFGFQFSITYSGTATCCSIYKHLPTFFREYDSYRTTFGSGLANAQIRRYLKVITVLGVSEILIDMAFLYTLTFHNADPKVIYLTPMEDLPQSCHPFMKAACFVLLLFNAMQLHFVLYFFIFITYCLSKEFSLVNTRIAKMFDKKNEDIPSSSEIEKVRQHFEDTCSLVNKASDVFKHMIGSSYIASVPVICLMLYGLIHDTLDKEEYLMVSLCMVLLICMVVVSTLTSVVLNMKAHSSLSSFLESEFSRLSDRSLLTINTFIMRLTTTNIGYTLYSLFTIDSSTILMLSGTMLTYIVVVLQFKTD